MNFLKVFTLRLAFALVILLFSLHSYSQEKKENKGFWSGWSVNVNAGPNLAYTDIDNYRFYRVFSNNSEWRAGYGIMLQKRAHPLIQLRGQIMNGKLSGTKRRYNYWFEADILETSLSGTLDLIGLFGGAKVRLVNFYGMAGIGFAQWKTDLKTLDNNEPLGGNGHGTGSGLWGRTTEAVIPFGLGLDFNISYHWNINVEASLRWLNSDVLDGKEAEFEYDFYSYNFVGVTYKFKKKRPQEPVIPPEDLIATEPIVPKKPIIEKTPQEKRVVVNEEQQNLLKLLQERMLEEDAKSGQYESPWKEVEFTVQVAASRTAIDPSVFQDKFNISGEIRRTHDEGWYYYTIGTYVKYWRAREYRNILLTRNNTKGAFVVAFKNGKRVLLSELLQNNIDERSGQQIAEIQRPISKKSFSVQIMATHDGNISPLAVKEMYEIDEEVYKEFDGGWYRYIVGNFMNYNEASKLRNKFRMRGLREAFIVGYKDGVRVPIESLRE